MRKSLGIGILVFMFIVMLSMNIVYGYDTNYWNSDTWNIPTEDYQLLATTDNAYYISYMGSGEWHVGANATFIPITEDMNDIEAGFVFRGLDINEDDEIYFAYIELRWFTDTITETGSGQSITIYGEKENNGTTYSTYAEFDARILTTAYVNTFINVAHQQGAVWRSPDISNIIEEIIGEAGYPNSGKTGLGIRILCSGNSIDQSVYGYAGGVPSSAILHISTSAVGHPTWDELLADYDSGCWVHIFWDFDDFTADAGGHNGWEDELYGWQTYGSVPAIVYCYIKAVDALSKPNELFFYSKTLGTHMYFRKTFNFTINNSWDYIVSRIYYGKQHASVRGAWWTGDIGSSSADYYGGWNMPVGWYSDLRSLGAVITDGFDVKLGQGFNANQEGWYDNLHLYIHFTDLTGVNLTQGLFDEDSDIYPFDVDIFCGGFPYPKYYDEENYDQNICQLNTTLTCLWNDTMSDLDTIIFSTNYTGVWVNTTIASDIGLKSYLAIYEHEWDGENATLYYEWLCNNTLDYWNYTGILELECIPFKFETASINSYDDDWLFMGEVYDLTATFYNPEYAEINFTDGYNWIEFRYYNTTKRMDVNCTNQYVAGLMYTDYENNYTSGEFNLTWRFILDRNIVDILNTTFYYYAEYGGLTINGTTGITRNIYNLGGFVTIETNNATHANRIIGGDGFDLYNYGINSTVEATAIFRKLQHVHLTCEWEQDNPYVAGTGLYLITSGNWCDIYFGFDYRLNNEWVEGWLAHVEIETGIVGNAGMGNDNSWMTLNVTWYNRGVKIKEDNITSFHYGYDVDTQPTDKRSVRLWVDLWFNRLLIDESNVVGGRVNAYYNGMKEFGNPWWFGYGNFRPVVSNVSASMFFDTLKDANNNTMSIYDIDLVRFKVGIHKVLDILDHDMRLYNYQILNYKTADDRMEGIDTPIFVEPEDISMPKGGSFLSPLYKAIEGISTSIWKGAMGFIRIFIGSIDSLLLWMGSPVTMSQMIEWIMIQGSSVSTWMIYVISQASAMLTVFTQMISWFLNIIDYAIRAISWVLINVVGFPLHVLRFIIAIIDGNTYTIGGFTWDFTIGHEIIQGAVALGGLMIGFMFVGWVMWGNIYFEGELDIEGLPRRLLNMFGWGKEIYNNVFWIFNRMRNEIISLYNFIRSHIGAGGGGGETEE